MKAKQTISLLITPVHTYPISCYRLADAMTIFFVRLSRPY